MRTAVTGLPVHPLFATISHAETPKAPSSFPRPPIRPTNLHYGLLDIPVNTERLPPPCDLSYLPDNVQSYLAALRNALLAALGVEQVLQIYLVGSASYPSGYIPGRSDLDVAVVTRSQLNQVALSRVPELCSHGALPCPADKLELVIYAYEAIHGRTALPYDISLNYNTGRALPRDHIRFGNNPDDSPHWFILDVAAAHAHNVVLLAGPDFAEVFTPQLEPQ